MNTETQQPPGKLDPPATSVSVASAAQILGKSRRTVQYMLEDGRLKGTRVPPLGWWKVSRDSVRRLRDRAGLESAPPAVNHETH